MSTSEGSSEVADELRPAVQVAGAGRNVLQRVAALTRGRVVAATTVLLFAVPALVDLWSSPVRAPYRWLAADTFYYLTVSRNFARHGRFAYDGEHASNGFQPVWQLWGGLLELLRERLALGQVGPLLLVLSGVAALAAAIWLLGVTLFKARRLSLAFMGLPVGLYAVIVLPAWMIGLRAITAHGLWAWRMPVFGSLWSYANGMESALVILCFALALYSAVAARALSSAGRAAGFGACLAGLTLARFDHGLIAGSLLVGFGLASVRARVPLRALQAALTFAALVTPVLLLNWHYFGNPVPLSGVAKSAFPRVTSDNVERLRLLLDGSPAWRPEAADSHWWLPVLGRQLQTIVPAALCLAYMVFALFRRGATLLHTLLASAACGAVVLAAYNFCFTKGEDQGFWYYPVSTLLPSLFVLAERWPRLRLKPPLRVAGAGLLVTLVVLFFVNWQRHPRYNEDFGMMVLEAPAQAHDFYGARLPKVLELDDGVVGYSLDTPAMSWLLGLDPEGFRAVKEGRLLDLAMARGFDRIASHWYRPNGTDPQALAQWAGASFRQDVSNYRFEKEFATNDGQLVIVRIYKR
jgi:hypothetical protein